MLRATAACNFSTSELQKVLRAPHFLRRAFSRRQNFEKWSDTNSFCAFSLQNALLATVACNFSTSELQKVLPDPGVLCIFTSKRASRHSGVQFLIFFAEDLPSQPALQRAYFSIDPTHESFKKKPISRLL